LSTKTFQALSHLVFRVEEMDEVSEVIASVPASTSANAASMTV